MLKISTSSHWPRESLLLKTIGRALCVASSGCVARCSELSPKGKVQTTLQSNYFFNHSYRNVCVAAMK